MLYQKSLEKFQFPTLRVIPVSFNSAVWNMAADEYLMQHSEVPVLRFYQWQKFRLFHLEALLAIFST